MAKPRPNITGRTDVNVPADTPAIGGTQPAYPPNTPDWVIQNGRHDCTDPRCTRINGICIGIHCSKCGGPCGSMGHSTGCPK